MRNRICFFVVMMIMGSVLVACGLSTDNIFPVNGVAEKGPVVKNSSVFIVEETSTLEPMSSEPYQLSTIDNLGTFNVSKIKFKSRYLKITVSGDYFNELSGTNSTGADTLELVAQIDTNLDRSLNVNVLTTLASSRIKKLVGEGMSFAKARILAENEVLSAFLIYNASNYFLGGKDSDNNITAATFNEAQLSNPNSIPNQILTVISSVILQAALDNKLSSEQLLTQLTNELADDGKLNGSVYPSITSKSIAATGLNLNFDKVANNLNTFFSTNSFSGNLLSPWIDSSGGVDMLIDKYKFTATSLDAQSPSYIVNEKDEEQCFSVTSGANLYVNGILATKPVIRAEEKMVLSVSLGTLSSAFIQRSPTNSKGACPQETPSSGTINVLKYSTVPYISFSAANIPRYYSATASPILPIGNQPRTLQTVIRTTNAFDYPLGCCGNGAVATWGTEYSVNQRFQTLITKNGNIYFCAYFDDLQGTKKINDGIWHIITITYDGSNIAIYVDGVLDVSGNTGNVFSNNYSLLNTSTNSTFFIGSDINPQQFIGDISRVTIWNTALNPSQVASITLDTKNFPIKPVSSFQLIGGNSPPSVITDTFDKNNILLLH